MSRLLAFRPLSAALGAVVENYDFSATPNAEQAEVLTNLLWKHQLLLFPGVDISAEQHRALLELFGMVVDEFGNGQYYSLVRSPDSDGGAELMYHCDFGFTTKPLELVSLYGAEVPAISARTEFASGVRACRCLPLGLRSRLNGRVVLHAADVTSENQKSLGRLRPEDLTSRQYTGALCPAILPHPKTGEEVLFLNDYMSIRFEDLSREESDRLLSDALAHLHSGDNVYQHDWRLGDLIVFDNIGLSHKRTNGPSRTLRRIVAGESPFLSVLPAMAKENRVSS